MPTIMPPRPPLAGAAGGSSRSTLRLATGRGRRCLTDKLGRRRGSSPHRAARASRPAWPLQSANSACDSRLSTGTAIVRQGSDAGGFILRGLGRGLFELGELGIERRRFRCGGGGGGRLGLRRNHDAAAKSAAKTGGRGRGPSRVWPAPTGRLAWPTPASPARAVGPAAARPWPAGLATGATLATGTGAGAGGAGGSTGFGRRRHRCGRAAFPGPPTVPIGLREEWPAACPTSPSCGF